MPVPLPPRRATIWPSDTDMSIPRRICTLPYPVATPRIDSTFEPPFSRHAWGARAPGQSRAVPIPRPRRMLRSGAGIYTTATGTDSVARAEFPTVSRAGLLRSAVGQEIEDPPRDLVRRVELGEMPGPGERARCGARPRLRPQIAARIAGTARPGPPRPTPASPRPRILGRRFARPVSLNGQSRRAAASWARSRSTSASTGSSPSGAATAAWKRAGSAQTIPGRSPGRCAQTSAIGSASSKTPSGPTRTRRRTMPRPHAATSAASAAPTDDATRSAPASPAASRRSWTARIQSSWGVEEIMPFRPRESPEWTARSPGAAPRGDRERASSVASPPMPAR